MCSHGTDGLEEHTRLAAVLDTGYMYLTHGYRVHGYKVQGTCTLHMGLVTGYRAHVPYTWDVSSHILNFKHTCISEAATAGAGLAVLSHHTAA